MNKELTEAQVLKAAEGQKSLRGLAKALGFTHANGRSLKKIKEVVPDIQDRLKGETQVSSVSSTVKTNTRKPKNTKKTKLPTKSTSDVDVIQKARKVSVHGYRGGYGIYDDFLSDGPHTVEAAVTHFCNEKAKLDKPHRVDEKTGEVFPWDPKDESCRDTALHSLRVVCNPAQRSNRNKTANVCGGTLTKEVTHIHLVAAGEDG